MSASLVGSEMCIRDRGRPNARERHHLRRRQTPWLPARARGPWARGRRNTPTPEQWRQVPRAIAAAKTGPAAGPTKGAG
eukprot:3413303-Alexandrium_andersonii.AAC.1